MKLGKRFYVCVGFDSFDFLWYLVRPQVIDDYHPAGSLKWECWKIFLLPVYFISITPHDYHVAV